jgi:hypothetical protein
MQRAAVSFAIVLLALQTIAHAGDPAPTKPDKPKPDFSFSDVEYFHRWSKDDQHEFTPAGQEDLKAWTDMVTIWQYRDVKDGEALAKIANTILEKYKAAKGNVLRTPSVPRTKDKPAEHFISVGFTQPDFREIAFARFKVHNGKGAAIIYSHRTYGQDARDKMRKWVVTNGLTPQKNLLNWDAMPKLEGLKQESKP